MPSRKKFTFLISAWTAMGMLYFLFRLPIPEIGDSLWIPSMQNESPKIFLFELTGQQDLTARQACAVESAANQNPRMTVVIYFSSLAFSIFHPHVNMLSTIPNVNFKYLNMSEIFRNTVLQNWFESGIWRQSPYKLAHLKDALRYTLLWKFGGIYLDLDVVVMKSLYGLENCIGKESDLLFNGGVMIFNQHHSFIRKCMVEFNATYDFKMGNYNGPLLVTRVLQRECGKNAIGITWRECNGITALPPTAFYPIACKHWKLFFDVDHADSVLSMWQDSYLIHMWNNYSNSRLIRIQSGQPYELAIKKYCPLVYRRNINMYTM